MPRAPTYVRPLYSWLKVAHCPTGVRVTHFPSAMALLTHFGSKWLGLEASLMDGATFGSTHPQTVRVRCAMVSAEALWPNVPRLTPTSKLARHHFRKECANRCVIKRTSCCPLGNKFDGRPI
jgi:hypothetical protein